MLSLASHLLSTLQGALSARASEAEDQTEPIRQAMIASLADAGYAPLRDMERRILLAPDAESLWYLRPELLTLLATRRGEGVARQVVENISWRFEGLLPRALYSPQPAMRPVPTRP